jgi:hypothetical protein
MLCDTGHYMVDKQQTEKVLRRILKGGIMRRMPKSMKDTEIFLALAASSLDPQCAYSESEINDHLIEWMEGFTRPSALDHVTVRRCLIDHYFLLRDQSGSSYTTNQTIINKVIDPAARSIQPRYIFEELQREREKRRRAAATSAEV